MIFYSYLIFVSNAGNAVSVNFLAECKKFQKNEKITALGSVCRKFTHFPSVKFPGLKMCECKKNDKYQVWTEAANMRYASCLKWSS